MEDAEYAIFFNDDAKVLYKEILDVRESTSLNNNLSKLNNWSNGAVIIATGIRKFKDIDLVENYGWIYDRLKVVLSDYFPDIDINKNCRFYSHTCGSVKPHTDACKDGKSLYTLLLYLDDAFEGGQLSIKVRRSDQEKSITLPNHNHKVFKFTPITGYGIIFHKSLVHWADEVIDGNKNFLLIHFSSSF